MRCVYGSETSVPHHTACASNLLNESFEAPIVSQNSRKVKRWQERREQAFYLTSTLGNHNVPGWQEGGGGESVPNLTTDAELQTS